MQRSPRKQGLKQNFFPLRGKTFTKNAYAVCSAKNRFGVSDLVKLSFLKERLLQESLKKQGLKFWVAQEFVYERQTCELQESPRKQGLKLKLTGYPLPPGVSCKKVYENKD